MSHIESVNVVLTDLEAVKKACTRLGVEFIEGKKTYGWFGRSVGDYPLPVGMTVEELGKCDHVIHVPGVDYEVGLIANKDGKGYKLAYDFWGSARQGGGLLAKFGKGVTKLVDAYSIEALRRVAQRKGYLVAEKVEGAKTILTVTGFAN